MCMNGHNDLDSHTSIWFTDFVFKSGHDPKSFRGNSVKNSPVVAEILQKTSLHTISISKKVIM